MTTEFNTSKPTPDPTVLTTEQLLREVDRAVSLLQAEMLGNKKVTEAKFNAIEREFLLVEDRRKEQKIDTKVAVDAALQAAEKAVKEQTIASEKSIIKSETSAAEQSKQQYATFTASLKGVTDTLTDVKDRVGKIEAVRLGSTEKALDIRIVFFSVFGFLLSSIVIAVSIISIITR